MPSFDPYADEDNTDEGNPLTQLRAHAAELEKDLKAERKAKEALERKMLDLETQRKTDLAASHFTQLGLPPSQAKLFLKDNPDAEVTEEAVKAFATDYGLIVTTAATPEPEPEEEPAPAFAPVPGTLPPAQTMGIEDWKKLYAANPGRALAMVEQGQTSF